MVRTSAHNRAIAKGVKAYHSCCSKNNCAKKKRVKKVRRSGRTRRKVVRFPYT